MADLTIAQRVEAGAAWLDHNKPGWWHTINLDRLDIESGCNCILGQVYGGYDESPFAARWDRETDAYLGDLRGFNSLGTLDRFAEVVDYRALTEAWRELIEERRTGIPV